MDKKIFESLKTKYANLGFSDEVLKGVATQLSAFVKEEDQIANAVAGAESMLKSFQSFADARVGKYKSEADRLKAQLASEAEKEGKENTKDVTDDVPTWAKTIVEEMKGIKTTVSSLQQEKVTETLRDQFIAKMKEKEVPQTFFETALVKRNFNTLDDVEDLVGVVSENFEKHKQDLADKGFSYTKPPENGGGKIEPTDEEAETILKQM